jgi:hypothetical protein
MKHTISMTQNFQIWLGCNPGIEQMTTIVFAEFTVARQKKNYSNQQRKYSKKP